MPLRVRRTHRFHARLKNRYETPVHLALGMVQLPVKRGRERTILLEDVVIHALTTLSGSHFQKCDSGRNRPSLHNLQNPLDFGSFATSGHRDSLRNEPVMIVLWKENRGKSTSVSATRFPLRLVAQQTTPITDSCTRRSRRASDPWGSLPPTKTRTSPTHYVQHARNNARSDERHLHGHPEGVFVWARLAAVRSRVLELPQC